MKKLYLMPLLLSLPVISFAGDWIADQNGCLAWNSYPQANESITWTGGCSNGKLSGNGTFQWYKDNQATDRYEGQYKDGMENGQGTLTQANGDRYEGQFKDGKKEGYGVSIEGGSTMDGMWKNGKMNGQGVMILSEPQRRGAQKVQGEFIDNMPTDQSKIFDGSGKYLDTVAGIREKNLESDLNTGAFFLKGLAGAVGLTGSSSSSDNDNDCYLRCNAERDNTYAICSGMSDEQRHTFSSTDRRDCEMKADSAKQYCTSACH